VGYWYRWQDYLLPLFGLVVVLGAVAVIALAVDAVRKEPIDPFGIHATATAQAAAPTAAPMR